MNRKIRTIQDGDNYVFSFLNAEKNEHYVIKQDGTIEEQDRFPSVDFKKELVNYSKEVVQLIKEIKHEIRTNTLNIVEKEAEIKENELNVTFEKKDYPYVLAFFYDYEGYKFANRYSVLMRGDYIFVLEGFLKTELEKAIKRFVLKKSSLRLKVLTDSRFNYDRETYHEFKIGDLVVDQYDGQKGRIGQIVDYCISEEFVEMLLVNYQGRKAYVPTRYAELKKEKMETK